MNPDPGSHRRRSIRLQGYDYAQAGAYFLTICAQDRACLFGDVVDGDIRLNDAGRMVVAEWGMLPQRFPGVDPDAFVVMPNHIHGVMVITAAAVGAGLVPALDRGTGNVGAGLAAPDRATTRVAPTTTPPPVGWRGGRGRPWDRSGACAILSLEVGMARAVNGGIEIFYLDEGEGRPVLLIHGHTLDHRIWDDVAPGLVERGLRVIRPDLRGHGRSTMPPKGYHVSHHAGDMQAVMDAAGVERATVVGFSVGGGVAMELAISHPERVAALALVAPVMPDRPFETAFVENLKAVAKVARTEGIRAAMAGPWASSPLFRVSLAKPGIRDKVEPILLDFPGAEYLATERDRVERDWTVPERLWEIQVPTVVLVGGEEMTGFKGYAAEAEERIPGATWHEVPGCGHLLPVEAPADVVSAVLEVIPEFAG